MLYRAVAVVVLSLLAFAGFAQEVVPDRGTLVPQPGANITGFVTAVNSNFITLFNGAVTIDATGAVFHNRRGPATMADLKPGLQVMVAIKNPTAAPGNTLQAASVVILDHPAGTLNGPVQSVDVAGSALTVLAARVLVTQSTRIYNARREGQGTIADIRQGDTVTIEINLNGSILTADVIHVMPPMPNASLEGTAKAIGATSWVITTRQGDVTVIVNADTRIDPSVKVGDAVQVIGIADAAGTITALSIHANEPGPPPPVDASIEGTVKSISTTSWVITTRSGDVTVTVKPETKIAPDINVGDAVIVVVRREEPNNVLALAIMKQGTRGRATRG